MLDSAPWKLKEGPFCAGCKWYSSRATGDFVVTIHKYACAVAAILFSMSIFGVVSAEEAEIFTVRDVEVDATAEAAAKARDIAISQGQRIALRDLLQRLTLKDDWTRLPQPSGAEINALIKGFEVEEEKNSQTRYLGKLSFAFKANNVRDLLRRYDIPFSEIRAKSTLLIPVYQSAEGPIIWAEENMWSETWATSGLAQALAPIVLPLGDLEDIAAISPETVTQSDWAQLGPIAARYGAGDIIIPVATTTEELGGVTTSVDVFQMSANGTSQYEVSFTAASEEEAFAQAVASIGGEKQENWKRRTIIQYGSEDVFEATIVFRSFNEWLSIRQRLANIPSITELRLVGLTVEGAQVNMKIAGSLENLSIALAQSDLELLDATRFLLIRPRLNDAEQASASGFTNGFQQAARAVPGIGAPTGFGEATGDISEWVPGTGALPVIGDGNLYYQQPTGGYPELTDEEPTIEDTDVQLAPFGE